VSSSSSSRRPRLVAEEGHASLAVCQRCRPAVQTSSACRHTKGTLKRGRAWDAGLATAGFATFPFNPISALCISTAICMRWTMIGHHVCHGGYNAQVGIDNRFHRATFARGPVRRFMDWCDWMLPEVGPCHLCKRSRVLSLREVLLGWCLALCLNPRPASL
jgi:hypothetical protein